MSAMLIVCAACERHVKSHEAACPFCGAELAPVPGEGAPQPTGVSRSKLLALGAAGVLGTTLAVTSCGGVYGGPPEGPPQPPPNTSGGGGDAGTGDAGH